EGSFEDFLTMDAAFVKMKDKTNIANYRADHLIKQRDYFFLNGKEIEYNFVMRFENLHNDLKKLTEQLKLPSNFFEIHVNISKKKYKHYSYFFNKERKKMIENIYPDDIQYLGYCFEDKRTLL